MAVPAHDTRDFSFAKKYDYISNNSLSVNLNVVSNLDTVVKIENLNQTYQIC